MGRADILSKIGDLERRIDALCSVVTGLSGAVVNLTDTVNRGRDQTDRMVDKLIEMALVTSGNPREALAARRLIPANTPLQTKDEPEEDDSDWFRMP